MLTCSQGSRSSPGAFAAGDTRALWIGRTLSARAEAIRPTFLTMMADLSDWGELLAKSGPFAIGEEKCGDEKRGST